jgi:hypothetical protein
MKKILTLSTFIIFTPTFFISCTKEPTKPQAPVKPLANAGASQTVQLPTSTTTLAGSGSTTNGSITGYLWSLISGPNVPVINSPASSSTTVNGLVAGTYLFQFAVTDNLGLTGIDSLSIVVNPSIAVKPLANAGVSQTIQLPVNTTTLSGSASTSNGSITGYIWSLMAGPNVPVINTPASATTIISGLVAGTYTFQFAVTDNLGLTGIDSLTVVVNPTVTQTLTFQSSNNPYDGHVDSYYNIGDKGDTEMPVGTWTGSGTVFSSRQFLKFDFSQIPSNSTIVSAMLYLYAMPNPHGGNLVSAHYGTDNACYVERISSDWSFTNMTWANQPLSEITNRVLIPQSTSAFENNTVNVTALVSDMLTNGNYGFKFTLKNEVYYNIRQWASSYYSDANLHPKLVIVYQ